jgi:TRAP-type C4-dicarboxylate transport system permease small subunit
VKRGKRRTTSVKIAVPIEKGIRKIENGFLIIGVGMLLVMMFLGAGDVLGRYLFNHPIKGALEVSQLMMAGVALLCWGYTQAIKSHINIEILLMRYPARVQSIINFFSLILTIVVFGLITWQSTLIAVETLKQHRMLENIPFPLFPFKFLVPVGASVLCLESIIQVFRFIFKEKREK